VSNDVSEVPSQQKEENHVENEHHDEEFRGWGFVSLVGGEFPLISLWR